jgi:hypothetical protein
MRILENDCKSNNKLQYVKNNFTLEIFVCKMINKNTNKIKNHEQDMYF